VTAGAADLPPLVVARLSDAQAAAVRDLVSGAPEAAESPALSERALLHLQSGPPTRHLVVEDGGRLLGYAQVEPDAPEAPEDDDEPPLTVEIVAAAGGRDAVTARLLEAALGLAAGRTVRIWAHGTASPVNGAAEASGLVIVRTLLQLRRPLAGLVDEPAPELPDGVTVRPFRPGADDAAWLRVNARAFATHPEQGAWTQDDLDERLAASWFDPAGFLLAVRDDGTLLGYHWTKVHNDAVDETGAPLGEVYVLGVDPAAQGLRLGLLLLVAGLRHLAERGIRTVLLYVDESNTSAVQLYRKLGFQTYAGDVQWSSASGAH
jgi:mycothiol synthase